MAASHRQQLQTRLLQGMQMLFAYTLAHPHSCSVGKCESSLSLLCLLETRQAASAVCLSSRLTSTVEVVSALPRQSHLMLKA